MPAQKTRQFRAGDGLGLQKIPAQAAGQAALLPVVLAVIAALQKVHSAVLLQELQVEQNVLVDFERLVKAQRADAAAAVELCPGGGQQPVPEQQGKQCCAQSGQIGKGPDGQLPGAGDTRISAKTKQHHAAVRRYVGCTQLLPQAGKQLVVGVRKHQPIDVGHGVQPCVAGGGGPAVGALQHTDALILRGQGAADRKGIVPAAVID